ncbi:MAG: hypothetical protein AAFN77_12120 [Planctomycetota bacterium]
MGMFDWIRDLLGLEKPDPNHEFESDLIWYDGEARMNGLVGVLEESQVKPMRQNQPIQARMLVAFFEESFETVAKLVDARNWPIPVEAIMVDDLIQMAVPDAAFDASRAIEIIVFGRHPSWKQHVAFKEAIKRLPFPTRVRCYQSMDDALLKPFATPFVMEIIKQSGFDESTPIESNMVTRRLINAQKKIDELSLSNQSARSESEWINANAPGFG